MVWSLTRKSKRKTALEGNWLYKEAYGWDRTYLETEFVNPWHALTSFLLHLLNCCGLRCNFVLLRAGQGREDGCVDWDLTSVISTCKWWVTRITYFVNPLAMIKRTNSFHQSRILLRMDRQISEFIFFPGTLRENVGLFCTRETASSSSFPSISPVIPSPTWPSCLRH